MSLIIRTSEIEVRVQLSPFRLAFYDLSGRLIAKDADSRGMSWEGARVRCWKWMPPKVIGRFTELVGRSPLRRGWPGGSGILNPVSGIWNLESGIWNLDCGPAALW